MLYAANRLIFKQLTPSVFMHGYFNDLLLIPCALPLVLKVQTLFRVRSKIKPPTAVEILAHLAAWSVICEWIGPHLYARSHGDPYDVLAYTVGGIGAWAWWNRSRGLKLST